MSLANVGDCVLRSTVGKSEDDLQLFADVLVHMFLPLQPVEANLQRSLDNTAYDFFTYVRGNKLMAALKVRVDTRRFDESNHSIAQIHD